MKKTIARLFAVTRLFAIVLCACAVAQAKGPSTKGAGSKTPPATGPWLLIKHTDSWKWSTVQGSSTITIPAGSSGGYPTCLVNTTFGNLSNKTISVTIALEDPTGIWYPGLGGWNNGGLPPNVRLYFSTVTTYNLNVADQDKFWFSGEFAVADFNMTVTSSTATSRWSNGQGAGSDDPAHAAAFLYALLNAKVVGVSLCGGDFFDMGWIYYTADGPALFTIVSLVVN